MKTEQEQIEEMAKQMCDTSPLEACYHLCLTDVVPCEAKKKEQFYYLKKATAKQVM